MTKTHAINDARDFRDLEAVINKLLPSRKYIRDPEAGSTSWKENDGGKRVLFKLFNFKDDENEWLAFGVRIEFLEKLGISEQDIVSVDKKPFHSMTAAPSEIEFLGFDVLNNMKSKRRIKTLVEFIQEQAII
jgi:hypothetical protein